ncbi:hypothetical protein QIS99_15630 [Streptomyces sp. B-S-A8]|uniref:Uncharacterized protein n=1 Tax=Streptomyces solicavernae TaxID=3043614 RepID=A0ABT6RT60_9ACTN|nr:hypothetical protein [Streptomyces sp. B-S-A8]MDI3387621.1 hypothetical protein [Streptomyces sp. B-S-A8]
MWGPFRRTGCDRDADGGPHALAFDVLLSLLAGRTEYEWDDLDGSGADPDEVRSRWRCPRNVAGFAEWAGGGVR